MQAFTGGFIATLLFHQGVLALFWLAGLIPAAPWNMSPVPLLGIPQVLSLAFWGGMWGGLMADPPLAGYSPLAWGADHRPHTLLVFPLKGLEVNAAKVVAGLIVNTAWGLAAWMRLNRVAGNRSP